MIKIIQFRCDNCGKLGERAKNELPYGWISIRVEMPEGFTIEWKELHACSNECAQRLLEKQKGLMKGFIANLMGEVGEVDSKNLINKIIEEVANDVHNDDEYNIFYDWDGLEATEEHRREAKKFIRKKLEKRIPVIETILGRSLTEEEIEKYVTEIEEWYNI